MLTSLDIKNIALIKYLNIEIATGMTALTGETGAGKSIIIDAVNLLLGARTNKTLVRYGEEKARVQGIFSACDEVLEILDGYGIDVDGDEVIICRDITDDGKSTCRINGSLVPAAILKEVGGLLINIHGQQDNQSLLNPQKHINFLDEYKKIDKSEYLALYTRRKDILKEIERLTENEGERQAKIEYLKYQVEEIENAALRMGEKEELLAQKVVLDNAEKIALAVNDAYNILYEENSAYDAVSVAASALSKIAGIDARIDEVVSKITDVQYVIEDCVHELRAFLGGVEFDERTLNDIEERLDLITRLERKYGGDVAAVMAFYEEATAEFLALSNAEETTEELTKELALVEKEIKAEAQKITAHRKSAAEALQKEIEAALADLDMPNVRFGVKIEARDYGKTGADSVEFIICANKGEEMKPLSEIASGGELSRVMLAIESIIADSTDTLIFDEIDTGVSGRAAKKIAEKLSALSRGRQVLCVTHQAQIAATADNHYKISKHEEDGRTVTEIAILSQDERITELAHIIDGNAESETAIKHAKEMLGL